MLLASSTHVSDLIKVLHIEAVSICQSKTLACEAIFWSKEFSQILSVAACIVDLVLSVKYCRFHRKSFYIV